MTPSSQFEWDVSHTNEQINSQNSDITGRRSHDAPFATKRAAEARLRNQGRNYSCRKKAESPASAEHCFYRRQANKQRRRCNPSKTDDHSSGGPESQVTASLCLPPPRSLLSRNVREFYSWNQRVLRVESSSTCWAQLPPCFHWNK